MIKRPPASSVAAGGGADEVKPEVFQVVQHTHHRAEPFDLRGPASRRRPAPVLNHVVKRSACVRSRGTPRSFNTAHAGVNHARRSARVGFPAPPGSSDAGRCCVTRPRAPLHETYLEPPPTARAKSGTGLSQARRSASRSWGPGPGRAPRARRRAASPNGCSPRRPPAAGIAGGEAARCLPRPSPPAHHQAAAEVAAGPLDLQRLAHQVVPVHVGERVPARDLANEEAHTPVCARWRRANESRRTTPGRSCEAHLRGA